MAVNFASLQVRSLFRTKVGDVSTAGSMFPCPNASFDVVPRSCGLTSRFPNISVAEARRFHNLYAQRSEPSALPADEEDVWDERESEEEARRRNWIEGRWAPWEELLSPEAQFAVESLAEGEEEAPISRETLKTLNPKYLKERRKKEFEEAAKKEAEEKEKEFNREGVKLWDFPLVFSLIPPRDWPPPGWKVDAKELAFIRGSQFLEDVRISEEDLKNVESDDLVPNFERWDMFLKQYHEWVAANKKAIEKEALEVDPEYYPGRRRTGDDYTEGMYELPFVYPGQHYWGIVSYVSLYEGAFVFYGGVHDGWVSIMDNDWYEIRKYIKVGMRVQVEVMAKRDPYRFRFPVEMRFVDPNIDDLIFRRSEYPPIFGRTDDDDLDEVAREANRPYFPKLRKKVDLEEEADKEFLVHPFIPRAWQMHEAEQLLLDDSDDEYDLEKEWPELVHDAVDWCGGQLVEEAVKGLQVPAFLVQVDEKDLDLVGASAEREAFTKLRQEAEARGEEFVRPESRFEKKVIELNKMHRQRWCEQQDAFVRDKTCRLELGMPLEEPGRYADKSFWGSTIYDPEDPLWRNDYWGDPEKLKEETKREREPQIKIVDEPVSEEDDEDELGVAEEEGKDDDQISYSRGRLSEQQKGDILDMKEGKWNYVDEKKGSNGTGKDGMRSDKK